MLTEMFAFIDLDMKVAIGSCPHDTQSLLKTKQMAKSTDSDLVKMNSIVLLRSRIQNAPCQKNAMRPSQPGNSLVDWEGSPLMWKILFPIYHNVAEFPRSRVNPFTPKSDQCQISPAASPIILHHTVWRTWLFITHSDERWLHYQFSLPHLYIFSLKGSENVLFESSGVKG